MQFTKHGNLGVQEIGERSGGDTLQGAKDGTKPRRLTRQGAGRGVREGGTELAGSFVLERIHERLHFTCTHMTENHRMHFIALFRGIRRLNIIKK